MPVLTPPGSNTCGTWSTMVTGTAGLVVGIFLALAFAATPRS
jgi:tetrahydromethanopterin S-methyltransferase subunit F